MQDALNLNTKDQEAVAIVVIALVKPVQEVPALNAVRVAWGDICLQGLVKPVIQLE